MQLTVRDVARLLKVREDQVYRWVTDYDLPAEQVNGQYRFNRAELLEWAALRKMEIPPDLFQPDNGPHPLRLDEALRIGGVFYDLPGADKGSALRAVVEAMPLPADFDRDLLVQVLLSRESVGSTALGDGLALPHPRYPVVLPLPRPFITLCFLAQPIPYSGADQRPVHTLFALVSPTVRAHLGLLSRLTSALRDPAFREVIRRRGPADDILVQARRVEDALRSPAAEGQEENR